MTALLIETVTVAMRRSLRVRRGNLTIKSTEIRIKVAVFQQISVELVQKRVITLTNQVPNAEQSQWKTVN